MIQIPNVTQILPYVVSGSAVFSILTLVYMFLTARQRREVSEAVKSAVKLVLLLQELTRTIIERIADFERQMQLIEVRKYNDDQFKLIDQTFQQLRKFQLEAIDASRKMQKTMRREGLVGIVELQSEVDSKTQELQNKIDSFIESVKIFEEKLRIAQIEVSSGDTEGENHG